MRLRIGGTLLDNNTASFVRRATAITNARKVPIAYRWEWQVRVLFASNELNAIARQRDFSRQEFQLRSLLSRRNQEIAFHCDDGTPSDAVLSPLGSTSGVDVLTIGNPVDGEGEYSGKRTMDFSIGATYPVGDPRGALISFEETLRFQGDGAPMWVENVGLLGVVVRQITMPKTECFAYQSGTAVGYLDYPVFGGPHGAPISFWPANLRPWESSYIKGAPPGEGNSLVNWSVSWQYTHSRWGTPFTGNPHLWR